MKSISRVRSWCHECVSRDLSPISPPTPPRPFQPTKTQQPTTGRIAYARDLLWSSEPCFTEARFEAPCTVAWLHDMLRVGRYSSAGAHLKLKHDVAQVGPLDLGHRAREHLLFVRRLRVETVALAGAGSSCTPGPLPGARLGQTAHEDSMIEKHRTRIYMALLRDNGTYIYTCWVLHERTAAKIT